MAEREQSSATPWDLAALRGSVPGYTWAEGVDSGHPLVRGLFYEGERYRGRDTRVFAWVGRPAGAPGGSLPVAGVVLIHGGGGRAFAEWAQMWAERGYAAIAMDLAGRGPDGEPLPDGGPDQTHRQKFHDLAEGVEAAWPYQSVANVMRATSLLASFEDVDETRLAVTGISWGGYLTCMVASLDDRFRAAVPVYGCGFLHHNSAWATETFPTMPGALVERWVRLFDPSSYLDRARLPMLWINGTNDFAYPLDSYQLSYRLAPGPRTLSVRVNMAHSHPEGCAPPSIARFIDGVLRDGPPLPTLGAPVRKGVHITADFRSTLAPTAAAVHHTADTGPWADRAWVTIPATLDGQTIRADLPATRSTDTGLTWFVSIEDERGGYVSSAHQTL